MDEQEFKDRTKRLALDVIELVESLGPGKTSDIVGRQLLRSATSVSANYRASCRGRSIPEIISKLAIVEEEADETIYWLELLTEAGRISPARTRTVIAESREILAMTVASKKTLRGRINARGFSNDERGG